MRVTNYSIPHQLDVFSVLITTHAFTLLTELSLIRYHAECEFYILPSKITGVRVQMCYFVCVSGFGSLMTEKATFSSVKCEVLIVLM